MISVCFPIDIVQKMSLMMSKVEEQTVSKEVQRTRD